MAWTAPRTWTTGELVTAAMMNSHVRDNLLFLSTFGVEGPDQDINGFTNTAYADLDATTTVTGTAVAFSVDTLTTALVILSSPLVINTTAAQSTYVSYRVSGASTIASADNKAIRGGDDSSIDGAITTTMVIYEDGLTAGTNVFELQARVTANAGRTINPTMVVIPLTT